MKHNFARNLCSSLILGILLPASCAQEGTMTTLQKAPSTIEQFHEIATQHNSKLVSHFNALSPQERIFIYYLFRASLPGNTIARDQLHRHTLEIIDIFETILEQQNTLRDHPDLTHFDVEKFLDEAKTYLVYLWTNHGPYFAREHAHEKRTPSSLALTNLTQENLLRVLTALNIAQAKEKLSRLRATIFDASYEDTGTVPDSIEKSAVNFYAPDFTEADFQQLSRKDQTKLNAYFYVEKSNGKRIPRAVPYSAQEKYGRELTIAVHWLNEAFEHAKKYPQNFDGHLVASLDSLIEFLKTGDEELFKKHSIEWAKSNSHVDYVFGFIEVYNDPKSHRGLFQAEATIKTIDMEKLNTLLPSIENQLPIPAEFKRENLTEGTASLTNASMNVPAFGVGQLGPMKITAAYCLPNYNEIRTKYGSKQIIYQSDKSLGELLNKKLNRSLFNLEKHASWLAKNDLDNQLTKDLWNAQCILHETLGHGSGKLGMHTFKENQDRTFEGITYAVGDTIPVTSENIAPFLKGYEQTIEELRAEIISLYASINHLDELMSVGLLKDWLAKMSKDELIEHLILNMVNAGLRRIIQQNDNATEIAGDHARANQTIMNYLLEGRGIELKQQPFMVDGDEHIVLGCAITNIEKAHAGIKDLMVLVQTIRSTGDGEAAQNLIERYGTKLNQDHLRILKKNMKTVVGNLKSIALIAPRFKPVKNASGEIIDIAAEWPKDIVDEHMHYKIIAFAK